MGSHSFTLGPSAIQGGGEFWDPTHKDGDGDQKSSWCGHVPDILMTVAAPGGKRRWWEALHRTNCDWQVGGWATCGVGPTQGHSWTLARDLRWCNDTISSCVGTNGPKVMERLLVNLAGI